MIKGASVQDIAFVCHESHRAYRESQGDGAVPKWRRMSGAEQQEVIARVKSVQEGHRVDPLFDAIVGAMTGAREEIVVTDAGMDALAETKPGRRQRREDCGE